VPAPFIQSGSLGEVAAARAIDLLSAAVADLVRSCPGPDNARGKGIKTPIIRFPYVTPGGETAWPSQLDVPAPWHGQ
jgi:hypothetical protein